MGGPGLVGPCYPVRVQSPCGSTFMESHGRLLRRGTMWPNLYCKASIWLQEIFKQGIGDKKSYGVSSREIECCFVESISVDFNSVQHFAKLFNTFFKRENIYLSYNPAIPFLDVYPTEIKTYAHKYSYTNVHSHFICITPEQEASQMPVSKMNRFWYTHTMSYYSPIKRNKLGMHAITQMDLKIILLSKRNQTWGIK